MDGTPSSEPSGTPLPASKQIIGGTRRRIYQHDEQLVMINRDKFDTLESITLDKSLFSQIGVACLTFALTLGLEKGIDYRQTPNDAGFYQILLCVLAGIVGLVFLGFTIRNGRRYKNQRSSLFADDKLLSDDMIIYTTNGTEHHSTAV